MHYRKELSDKISRLYRIDKDQFDPKIHFPLADEIIKGIDTPKMSFLERLGLKNLKSPARIGDYYLEQTDRMNLLRIGYHQKITIIHWKSKFYGLDYRYKQMAITYNNDSAIAVASFENSPIIFDFGRANLRLSYTKFHWCVKR